MALTTVGDIIGEVRVLIMDTDAAGYRYDDASVYQALNEGMLEARRIRPDFFRGVWPTPQYSPTDVDVSINFPEQFRPALIDYVCGRVQLRDDESTQDQRAGVFISSFRVLLSGNPQG
jgi:hypothetical protein